MAHEVLRAGIRQRRTWKGPHLVGPIFQWEKLMTTERKREEGKVWTQRQEGRKKKPKNISNQGRQPQQVLKWGNDGIKGKARTGGREGGSGQVPAMREPGTGGVCRAVCLWEDISGRTRSKGLGPPCQEVPTAGSGEEYHRLSVVRDPGAEEGAGLILRKQHMGWGLPTPDRHKSRREEHPGSPGSRAPEAPAPA